MKILLGIGVGAVMQNTIIALQANVKVHEIPQVRRNAFVRVSIVTTAELLGLFSSFFTRVGLGLRHFLPIDRYVPAFLPSLSLVM